MSYSNSPYVPKKPSEYDTRAAQPSMTDLLQSLNIDEEPSHHSRGLYSRPQGTFEATGVSGGADIGARSRSNTAVSRYDTHYMSIESQLPNNPAQQRLHSQSRQELEASTSATSEKKETPTTSPQAHKIARKPVDTTPTRRVYYSPDDLDDLIPKARLDQDNRSSRPLPAPVGMVHSASSRTLMSSGDKRYSAHAEQFPGQSQYEPQLQQPQNFYSSSPDGRVFRDRGNSTGAYSDRDGLYDHSGSRMYGRSDSPTHRSSLPPVHPQAFATDPRAFAASHDLAPRSGYQMAGSPERQNSMPYRPQSSLSNHSQQSPDRSASYRQSGLFSQPQQILRMPSPERSQYYAPSPVELGEDRAYNASVPPTTQARRGRQKGEIVAESDLPAMPLLFAESRRPDDEPVMTSTLPQPVTTSPSRSPTRNSNIIPHLSPRKRNSFARAPDLLQSVKVLPIKPIKCPPLCLEERYHPYAFVKTNKFKIKVFPAQSTFVAGGEIFGHIDIVSEEGFRAQFGSTQVVVGEIGVEVIGYEEIQNAETGHNARSFTFLFSRKVFQTLADTHPVRALGEHILSSAVLNDPPPDQDGYRAASKGTSSFPFAFPLPVDAPSSADLNIARVKYLITGYATVKLQGSHEIMATSVPVRVVEAWDVGNPVYEAPIDAAQGRDIANYHEIAATAQIPRSLYMEGETIMGNVRIANHSSKKIREIKFLLVNRITLFGDKRSPANELNPPEDVQVEQLTTGHVEPHIIARGDHESWNFSIHIPPEKCLSVRNTALFEVTPEVLIKISTGPLQKSTRLYIPQLSIACPDSMVNNQDRIAPTSAMMRWATLPSLYRFQRVIDGALQTPEKGGLEVTELITYHTAQQRVALLTELE